MYLFNYLWMNCLEDDDISEHSTRRVWKVSFLLLLFLGGGREMGEKQVLALYLFIFLSFFFVFGLCLKFLSHHQQSGTRASGRKWGEKRCWKIFDVGKGESVVREERNANCGTRKFISNWHEIWRDTIIILF
jgi:hypothetical protein